jgi:APA family basic amino acid/polyamine antiporter
MASEGLLPASSFFAELNNKQVPANSIILVGTFAALYSLIGQFDLLTDIGTFSCWIFYTLTFCCVITMRRKHPEYERKYKVPGYPIVPALAIVSGLFVIGSQLFLSGSVGRWMAFASVAITLLGLPIYLYITKER